MNELVYLIGGSGFVGKHLSVFLSYNFDVTIFDKKIDTEYFSSYPQIKSCELDVVHSQIPESFPVPSFIINLASTLVTASRDLENFDGIIAENVKILLNLFERFRNQRGMKLFIQFGSIEEYGNGLSPFVETQREMPNSVYALLKQTTTNTAMMLHRNYDFPAMVVRPGNLFGQGQNRERFIPYVFNQLQENKPLAVTLCEQKRDYIYITDFNEIINEIMSGYRVFVGEVVNVSSGRSIALKELIEEMKLLLHSTSEVQYGKLPYRENEAMNLECSVDKLERLLDRNLRINTVKRLKDYIDDMCIKEL